MPIIKNTKLQLFILYICICITLALRINVESTGYMSPDSDFYTVAAINYQLGKGFVAPTTYPFDETSPESFMAVWPIGYPAVIASVSYMTGFDAFTSSKLANAVFLGFIFILLYYWFGAYSLLPACYFCSFNQLEIFSYTWSEGAFLFFLLWMLYLLEKVLSLKSSYVHTALLIFCLVAMTLLRYAGLFYFLYVSLFTVILYLQKKYISARQLTVVISISGFLIFSYLLNNYFISGGFFGGLPRILPEMESWSLFLKLLFHGFVNELFIARNFYWFWDPIFVLLIVLQLFVVFYLFRKRDYLYLGPSENNNNFMIILSGLFYLIFIILLRRLPFFEAFNYRILAPFSAPIFIILLGNLRYKKVPQTSYIKIAIAGFFIISLIMNLPKVFILSWLGVI